MNIYLDCKVKVNISPFILYIPYHVGIYGKNNTYTSMSHFKVRKGTCLCNWHCKHEHVKYQTLYQKLAKI